MKVRIQDRDALAAVSPAALAAYAGSLGWGKSDSFGDHSDVYVGKGLPEIILPRTKILGDYSLVISQLVSVIARVVNRDELFVYRNMVTADRDVIRLRVSDSGEDGSVPVQSGIELLTGAQEMILATACSLDEPRPVFRVGANQNAVNLLRQARLGQTEQGSFVVTILMPVIPPRIQSTLGGGLDPMDDPIGRRLSKHLESVLLATQRATERVIGGDERAFIDAVQSGVSANLCEAVARVVRSFPVLETSISWARTRSIDKTRSSFEFGAADGEILSEAARSLRSKEPEPDTQVTGVVHQLQRKESQAEGTITLRAWVDGGSRSVVSVLSKSDYDRAISAHRQKDPVVIRGDLERFGQRWRLLNPQIVDVISTDDDQAT